MPASAWATRVSGLTRPATSSPTRRCSSTRTCCSSATSFAIPASWPLSNVFSIGDVALVIGGAILIHSTCETRLTVPAVRAPRPMCASRVTPR
jgi:hypothetical protein